MKTKLIVITILSLFFLSNSRIPTKKYKSKSMPIGTYRLDNINTGFVTWIKIEESNEPRRGGYGQVITFKSKNQFKAIRHPRCGNDIMYEVSGTYLYQGKSLKLNYTKGQVNDGLGDDSVYVFSPGVESYTIQYLRPDSIVAVYKGGSFLSKKLNDKPGR